MLLILEIRLDDEPAEVASGLHRNHALRGQIAPHAEILEQRVCVLVIRITSGVVRVHAEVVSQPMGHERDARPLLQDLARVALQDAQLEKPIDEDFVCQLVDAIPEDAGFQHGDGLALHLEDDLVDGE